MWLVGVDNIEKRLYSSSYLRWCVLQALDSIWEISAYYIKDRTSDSYEPLVSDHDAEYIKVFNFDVSTLQPQIVPPP